LEATTGFRERAVRHHSRLQQAVPVSAQAAVHEEVAVTVDGPPASTRTRGGERLIAPTLPCCEMSGV